MKINICWSASQKKQEAYKRTIEMSRSDDYTTGNLLDFSYHQSNYKLIDIDSSRQTNTNIPHQAKFTGKSEEDDGATMFFITEKEQKTFLNFSLNSLMNDANDSKFVTRKWNIANDNSNRKNMMQQMRLLLTQKF